MCSICSVQTCVMLAIARKMHNIKFLKMHTNFVSEDMNRTDTWKT